MNTLNNINNGNECTIIDIKTNGKLRRRLNEMGITRGQKVTVKGRAPFGDPLRILVRGYMLAIREADAKHILVK